MHLFITRMINCDNPTTVDYQGGAPQSFKIKYLPLALLDLLLSISFCQNINHWANLTRGLEYKVHVRLSKAALLEPLIRVRGEIYV